MSNDSSKNPVEEITMVACTSCEREEYVDLVNEAGDCFECSGGSEYD